MITNTNKTKITCETT